MAVREVVKTQPDASVLNTMVATWEGLATGDTGKSFAGGDYTDKTIHVFGDFTGGGSVSLQGSNDARANPSHPSHASASWVTCKDDGGAAITFSATNSGALVATNYYWNRITVTGTVADVDVGLCGRRIK